MAKYMNQQYQIRVKSSQIDDALTLTATNNGRRNAYFVFANAIFLKRGRIVATDIVYLINQSTDALGPKQTLSQTLHAYTDYDRVIYSYTARDQY